uniref:PCI domain-containing protein n=1 Tax=Ditylenchus dipsaci TaxID=166011 RepID=A0A915D2L6_9BILA
MEHEFMEPEYQVDEPNGDFDMVNANDILDIDENEPINEETNRPSTVNSVQIDLDSVLKKYTGYALMNRLLFISEVCPPLRFDALKMLIEYVMKSTHNCEAIGTNYGNRQNPSLDGNWVDQTSAKSQNQLEAYLAEFKRQKDEAVKESIRRSLDEVFHQNVQMGNIHEALKLYGRGMRQEYCTAPNYVLQMLINWINVTIYAQHWPKLGILLPQAERAIAEVVDRESVAATSTTRSGVSSFSSSAINPAKNYKELVMSSKARIASVSGLAKMQDKQYKAAAEKFMTVDIDALDYPQLLAASDVAVYGTLCALATFTRVELKEKVLGCTLFRKFLESEPKLVELLQKFCRSEFGICLDILAELRDSLLLDMFLSPHIHQLYALIRQSSIVQYFHPYLTADIRNMAVEFRTSLEEMEIELINLIEKGLLSARIDSYGKILISKFSDNRAETYKRVNDLRRHLNERVYAILLRAALQNHRINIGYSDKIMGGKGRRRGNAGNYIMNLDGMDMGGNGDNYFDNETTTTSTSGTSTSSRMMAQVLKTTGRLFNAATSRIHPSLAESSTGNHLATSSNNGDQEVIPMVPGGGGNSPPVASSSNDSRVPPDCSMPSRNDGVGNRGGQQSSSITNSDMELDENLGDI